MSILQSNPPKGTIYTRFMRLFSGLQCLTSNKSGFNKKEKSF